MSHPNILGQETLLEHDGKRKKLVLRIYTDLKLDAFHPQHDKEKVNELVNFCLEHIQGNGYDSFFIAESR